jgi:endonuclease YncB( thermonuclease family)
VSRLRRLLPLPLAFVAAVLAGCGSDGAPAHLHPTREEAVVAFVTDGDSIRLRDGRRLRLLQVDAPELGECHHAASTRTLRRLLPSGRRIQLHTDLALDELDEHGRLLRYVLAGDLNVNLQLVELGAAAPYFFRGGRGRHARALLRAARAARSAARGLWGACPGATLDPRRGAVTRR